MRVLLAVLLYLGVAAPAAAQLSGRVVDIQSGDAVVHASVRLYSAGGEHEVFTDRTGAYTFSSVRPAEYWLIVRHPGYEGVDLRVVLRAGSDVVVNVPLAVQPIPVTRVIVPASRAVAGRGADAPADSLLEQIEERQNTALRTAVPAALRDLVQAEVREPETDPGGAPSRSLNVWGSSAERGRVMIDGATINAPLHLGSILSPVESQLLAGAELHTGGASARYDGGTSYIVQYLTRAPADELRAWGEIGLLTSRLGFETPVRGGSFSGAARRVNDEAVDALIDGAFEYAYNDLLARIAVPTSDGHSFRAFVLGTRETVRIPRDLADDEAAWDNFASIVSWGADRPGAGPLVSLSYSRGVIGLPLLSAPDGHLEATMERAALAASHAWHGADVTFQTGIDVEHVLLDRRSSASYDEAMLPSMAGRVECTASLPCANAQATTAAAWGDLHWQPSRRIAVDVGMRAMIDSENMPHVLPRFALTWVGSGSTTATVSAGRYSQIGILEATPGVVATVFSELLTPTRLATHYELRVSHRGSAFALEASGFIRRQHRPGSVDDSEFVPGAEIAWALARDRTSLSGGYSLLGGTATWDGTLMPQHFAFLGASTGRGPLQLDLAGAYGHGVPLTSIVLDRPATLLGTAESPDPMSTPFEDGPYMRVDAVLSGDFSMELNGRRIQFTPYAKLINAFTRRSALFYYREDATSELQPLSALPTMPVLGLRWVF